MAHLPGLIQCHHRLGAGHLTHAGVHQPQRQRDIGGAQHALHHRPALIGLGHHPVGFPGLRGFRHGPRPALGGRAGHAGIGEHAGNPVRTQPHRHDPAGISPTRCGRIHSDHHPHQRRGRHRLAALLDHRAGPQRAFMVGDQLAIQFLPRQLRMPKAAANIANKACGQIGLIILGFTTGNHHLLLAHQPFQQRHGARRRGGSHLRLFAQSQSKQQIVPRMLCSTPRIIPFGNFVAPRMAMLRPAQPIRLASGIKRCLRAIGPADPPQRRLKHRPAPRRAQRQNPAFPLHHHGARLGQRSPHQRDPRPRLMLG